MLLFLLKVPIVNGSRLPNIRVLQQHLSGAAAVAPGAAQNLPGGASNPGNGFLPPAITAGLVTNGVANPTLTSFMRDTVGHSGTGGGGGSVALICQGTWSDS